MDPHPTPFPGKHRPTTNLKKEKGESKSSKETGLVSSRYRQKRVFGTSRSTNIAIEKPLPKPSSAKICKPSKPSETSTKPLNEDGQVIETKVEIKKASCNAVKDAASKLNTETKKSRVRFQDLQQPPEKGRGRNLPEDGLRTPMTSMKPVVLGTPFYSAEKCSKCRFDKLESASYWLNQIKLAESVGKHFVSSAFFRLALECNAQPSRSLKSELKRYMARHSSLPILTIWRDVCHGYGLSNDEPTSGGIGFSKISSLEENGDHKSNLKDGMSCNNNDECLECSSSGIQHPVALEEELINNAGISSSEMNDNSVKDPFVDVNDHGSSEDTTKSTPNTFDNFLLKDNTQDDVLICRSGTKNSLKVIVSGKKLFAKKADKGNTLSPSDDLSTIKKTGSGGFVDKGEMMLNKAKTQFFSGEATKKNSSGHRKCQSSWLNSEERAVEKTTSPFRNESHDVGIAVKDEATNQILSRE